MKTRVVGITLFIILILATVMTLVSFSINGYATLQTKFYNHESQNYTDKITSNLKFVQSKTPEYEEIDVFVYLQDTPSETQLKSLENRGFTFKDSSLIRINSNSNETLVTGKVTHKNLLDLCKLTFVTKVNAAQVK